MRIEKNNEIIDSMIAWEQVAGLKSSTQWVEGRSAFELARAWVESGTPAMPVELRTLLDSRTETKGLVVDVVLPEYQIAFDTRSGEPRNADLAFLGRVGAAQVAVTVEAKADEPFGLTIADTVSDALERSLENERSEGVGRVQDLVRALLPIRSKGLPHLGGLRYQLLTAVAGTVAYAIQNAASCGVLVVHEFVTHKTRPERHEQNAEDYRTFLHRLGHGSVPPSVRELAGPFTLPGKPLFVDVPPLFIGKVTTDRLSA